MKTLIFTFAPPFEQCAVVVISIYTNIPYRNKNLTKKEIFDTPCAGLHVKKVAHFWYCWLEFCKMLGLRVAGGFSGVSPVLTFKPSKTKLSVVKVEKNCEKN